MFASAGFNPSPGLPPFLARFCLKIYLHEKRLSHAGRFFPGGSIGFGAPSSGAAPCPVGPHAEPATAVRGRGGDGNLRLLQQRQRVQSGKRKLLSTRPAETAVQECLGPPSHCRGSRCFQCNFESLSKVLVEIILSCADRPVFGGVLLEQGTDVSHADEYVALCEALYGMQRRRARAGRNQTVERAAAKKSLKCLQMQLRQSSRRKWQSVSSPSHRPHTHRGETAVWRGGHRSREPMALLPPFVPHSCTSFNSKVENNRKVRARVAAWMHPSPPWEPFSFSGAKHVIKLVPLTETPSPVCEGFLLGP